MQRNALDSSDLHQQTTIPPLRSNRYLNLPDLSFYLKCKQYYQISRGVYNSIDHWFFENGMIHVTNRRLYILAFLDFVKDSTKTDSIDHKLIRIGHKELTDKLNEFITTYLNINVECENY